ncbi:MAG: hypothetical protein U0792_08230 [Gemmataceae bacterium]
MFSLLAGFAVWFLFPMEREPRNDAERLVGEWQITIAGRPTPNAVIVTGDRWEHHGGKAYRVTLNETADPREITLEQVDGPRVKGPPVKMHGVYAFDNSNKFRIRVLPATEPRPKTLDDPEAPEWVLTRVKLEPVPQPGK